MAVANNVKAILKDIKVTKKGIVLSFEDVRLQGEQLTDLASLIGGLVLIDVEAPQLSLFEDEDVNEIEATEEESVEESADDTEEVTAEATEEEEDYSQLTFEQMDEEEERPQEVDGTPQYMTFAEEDPITFTDDEVAQQLDL